MRARVTTAQPTQGAARAYPVFTRPGASAGAPTRWTGLTQPAWEWRGSREAGVSDTQAAAILPPATSRARVPESQIPTSSGHAPCYAASRKAETEPRRCQWLTCMDEQGESSAGTWEEWVGRKECETFGGRPGSSPCDVTSMARPTRPITSRWCLRSSSAEELGQRSSRRKRGQDEHRRGGASDARSRFAAKPRQPGRASRASRVRWPPRRGGGGGSLARSIRGAVVDPARGADSVPRLTASAAGGGVWAWKAGDALAGVGGLRKRVGGARVAPKSRTKRRVERRPRMRTRPGERAPRVPGTVDEP